MIGKSGKYFCDKIMLKQLMFREFFDQMFPSDRDARSPGEPLNWHPSGSVRLQPERSRDERSRHRGADALPNDAGGGAPMAGYERDAARNAFR
jgi:hypothetical protein